MKRLNNKININFELVMFILSISCILIIIATFSLASSYSFFQSDDFYNAALIKKSSSNIFSLMSDSFDFAKQIWFTWQGTYFSMFMQRLLSPLNGYGEIQQSIVMVFNVILVFTSFILMMYEALAKNTEYIGMKGKSIYWIMTLIALIVFSFTSYKTYPEVYYWYTGAIQYTLPLSCLFLSIYFLCKSFANSKFKLVNMFLSIMFGIFMSGGSLQIAGVGCFIYLSLLIFSKNKKIFLLFVICFLCTLFNTIAPGNFIRQSGMDGGFQVFASGFKTIRILFQHIDWFLSSTTFYGVLVLALIVGILSSNYTKFKYPPISLLIVFFILLACISIFPIVIAYANTNIFPTRCKFLLDLIIITGFILIFSLLGQRCLKFMNSKENIILLTIIFFGIFFSNYQYSLGNLISVKTLAVSINGNLKTYTDDIKGVYNYIDENRKQEIFVFKNIVTENDIYLDMLMSEDENFYANKQVSLYYNVQSIVVTNE